MSSQDPIPTLVDRVTHFVAENKRTILIGTAAAAAAIAVGGVAYYAASTSSSASGAKKDKKDSKKKGDKKKKKGVNDPDGPLLEERKPATRVEEVTGTFPTLPSVFH
jgi:mitochondrial import receptor subunit TOM70